MRSGKQFIAGLLGWMAGTLLLATTLIAQIVGSGAVQGTITDPSGAVIPGAQAVATNVATGAKSVPSAILLALIPTAQKDSLL